MSTTKKKPGRPRKVVNEAPKKEVKNAAFYKRIAEEIAESHDVLEVRLERALEDKEYWFQIAEKAHKEQETMLATLGELVNDTINSMMNVHETTNDINPLDILYNVNMIQRVMNVKFNSPTEE
jgi:hypothetical protein